MNHFSPVTLTEEEVRCLLAGTPTAAEAADAGVDSDDRWGYRQAIRTVLFPHLLPAVGLDGLILAARQETADE